jgi:hypothetical protein
VIFSIELWDKTCQGEITVETKKKAIIWTCDADGKMNWQKGVQWIGTLRGVGEEEN